MFPRAVGSKSFLLALLFVYLYSSKGLLLLGDKFAYSSGDINFFMLRACILSISLSKALVTSLCLVKLFFPSNFGLTQNCISNALPHDPEVSTMDTWDASRCDFKSSSILATDDILLFLRLLLLLCVCVCACVSNEEFTSLWFTFPYPVESF